jgi:hypothetical protein
MIPWQLKHNERNQSLTGYDLARSRRDWLRTGYEKS